MSEVLFFSYVKSINAVEGLGRLISRSGFEDVIPGGESIAIKLHMGELGNTRYIRPVFVRKVVDIVKSNGGKPFLFDTVVNYPGARDTREKYLRTAAKNGFTEVSVGAPVVIADDDDEQQSIPVSNRIGNCQLEEVKSSSLLLNSPCLIVLSHVKGHEISGFGGAVKNLGMGCVSRETKRAQHYVNMPQFNEESDCDGCGKCAEVCPTGAITIVDGRPERVVAECSSCGTCLFMCPSHCWVWPPGSKETIQIYLGHAATAVVAGYRGKIAYVNFIQDVVPLCDCVAASGTPVVQDIGIAFSLDPVAIDKASLDLIDQAPIIPGSTSVKPPDIMGKIHKTSSLVQLETAEKLKLGTMKYELVSV